MTRSQRQLGMLVAATLFSACSARAPRESIAGPDLAFSATSNAPSELACGALGTPHGLPLEVGLRTVEGAWLLAIKAKQGGETWLDAIASDVVVAITEAGHGVRTTRGLEQRGASGLGLRWVPRAAVERVVVTWRDGDAVGFRVDLAPDTQESAGPAFSRPGFSRIEGFGLVREAIMIPAANGAKSEEKIDD